jgi:hypothetical protein
VRHYNSTVRLIASHEETYWDILKLSSLHTTITEKELREAAHAEVALATGVAAVETEKSGKRRKDVDTAEKVQQR